MLTRLLTRCHRLTTSHLNNVRRSYVTVAQEMAKWQTKFEEEKILEPESSIRNLVASVYNMKTLDEVDTILDIELEPAKRDVFENYCNARLAKMPVQYIVREWPASAVTYTLEPPVFIPRPETIELCEIVQKDFVDYNCPAGANVLDIGCGSGVVTCELLSHLPHLNIFAFDRSKQAVRLTQTNTNRLVQENSNVNPPSIFNFELTDETAVTGLPESLLEQNYFAIVSNPPYIPTKEIKELDDDVKLYEDIRALDGGTDGLKVIKMILKLGKRLLTQNRRIWLEVHPSHPKMLTEMLDDDKEMGLKVDKIVNDFCGKERFVKIIRTE